MMMFVTVARADICTDDYIISGGRSIPLLPDYPFEISESQSILIVRRGTLIFKFTNPIEVFDGQIKTVSYSTILIGDKYIFELTDLGSGQGRSWKQYASGGNVRGFGGICKYE